MEIWVMEPELFRALKDAMKVQVEYGTGRALYQGLPVVVDHRVKGMIKTTIEKGVTPFIPDRRS